MIYSDPPPTNVTGYGCGFIFSKSGELPLMLNSRPQMAAISMQKLPEAPDVCQADLTPPLLSPCSEAVCPANRKHSPSMFLEHSRGKGPDVHTSACMRLVLTCSQPMPMAYEHISKQDTLKFVRKFKKQTRDALKKKPQEL